MIEEEVTIRKIVTFNVQFLHKHKDYMIKCCIIMKMLVYILEQHVFILCHCVSVCMYVCVYHVCAGCSWKPEECLWFPSDKTPIYISLSSDTESRALSTLSTTIYKML